jgi:hypothetical protein
MEIQDFVDAIPAREMKLRLAPAAYSQLRAMD